MIVAVIVLAWTLFVSMVINFMYFANEGIDKKDVVGLLLMLFVPPYLFAWIIWQIVMAVRCRRARKKLKEEESAEENE